MKARWLAHKGQDDQQVRNRVRVARVEKRLSQQELADAIGVTRQTIGLIENERYNPTITLCLRLASVLGKSLDDLFWFEDDADENRS